MIVRAKAISEHAELAQLEQVIEAGLAEIRALFRSVGEALREIRDARLYRAGYKTFDAYAQARWGLARSRAYQLIDAADVVDDLSTVVDILPESERQTRPLVPLEPDERREVWQEAVESSEGQQPSAARVQEIAARVLANLPEEARAAVLAEAKASIEAKAATAQRDDAQAYGRAAYALSSRAAKRARRAIAAGDGGADLAAWAELLAAAFRAAPRRFAPAGAGAT